MMIEETLTAHDLTHTLPSDRRHYIRLVDMPATTEPRNSSHLLVEI